MFPGLNGKNSTEPQKNSKKHVFLTNPQNIEKHTGAGGEGGGMTQKHVFWGLTKNIEKHFYHRLGGPAGGCPPALVPVVG